MRHAVMLGLAAAITAFLASWSAAGLGPMMVNLLGNAHDIRLDGRGGAGLGAAMGWQLLLALAAPMGLLFVGALVAGLLQGRPTWSAEKLKPKLDKISPLAGFKRLFGMSGWVEFLKSIAKMLIVGAVATAVVWPYSVRLEQTVLSPTQDLLLLIKGMSVRLLAAVAAIVILLAGIDFLYQRFAFLKRMRMSRQDIKDEHKQSEGDPHVKARIRQIRMERSRKRMMAAVPTADVVITNPTHFAVALKYDGAAMGAPTVVAKGVDSLALRIRGLAEEHKVPIVENPPLARSLYATVELDEEVKPEHYKAVAQVISYVMGLRRKPAVR